MSPRARSSGAHAGPMHVGRRPEQCPVLPERPLGSILARTSGGEIMGVRHRELAVEGVQFHPESVLTPEGDQLLGNFLQMSI